MCEKIDHQVSQRMKQWKPVMGVNLEDQRFERHDHVELECRRAAP